MAGNEEMEDKRTSPPVRPEYDDEVELIDYLRVLWKYRFWIIGATILSALSALAISFILPPIWEVSIVVEPGRFGSDVFETGTTRPAGKIYYIDTAENVKAKIAQGSYDAQVRTISGWPSDKKIKWDVEVEKGTSAVRASLEVKDRELGIKALEVLVSSLEGEFAKKLGTFQGEIEQKIVKSTEDITKVRKDIERVQTERDASLAKLEEEVRKLETDIERVQNERDTNLAKLEEESKKLKAEIALLKQREQELSREEESVRNNTELLMTKRNSLIEGEQARPDPLALVLYTTSLQQNIAYFNQLVNQLSDVRRTIEDKLASIKKLEIERERIKENSALSIKKINSEIKKNQVERIRVKEDAVLRIKKLESDIQKIEASIKTYEERRNFARPIEIIQPPTISYKPVKPKKKLNTAIAGILGLFVSVFAVFFTEYISKNRTE